VGRMGAKISSVFELSAPFGNQGQDDPIVGRLVNLVGANNRRPTISNYSFTYTLIC